MKFALFVLMIFSGIRSFAQNPDSISKIIFKYVNGNNSWGNPGTYSKEEYIEVTKVNDRVFKITKRLSITNSAGIDGKTFSRDTLIIATKNYPAISIRQIKGLFNQLHTSKDNFNTAFLLPRLKAPSAELITEIAKSDTNLYRHLLDTGYLDASESRAAIKHMRKFDKLDLFLKKNQPDTNFLKHGMVAEHIDVWNDLRMLFITKGDTVKFDSSLFELLGQPFYDYQYKKPRFVSIVNTVNLQINESIAQILPKSSFLKKNIDLNVVTSEYINWYIIEELH